MSPLDLEHELRAALHEGDDQVVPVGLAARSLARVRQRRLRLGGTAGIIATVLALGVIGVTVHARSGHRNVVDGLDAGGAHGFEQPARSEVATLLSAAVLPPSAVRTSERPAALHQPVVSASADEVDAGPAYYAVPETAADTEAYLQQHLPAGLSPSETGGSFDPAHVEAFVSFAAADTASYLQATLSYSILQTGPRRSVLRVDASAVAINPAPIRVHDSGPLLRVTVAGRCPASDRIGTGLAGVSNPDSEGLTTAMLPSGVPSRARICRYDGLNGHPFALVAQSTTNSPGARVQAVRATDLGHTDLPFSCPAADDGAVVVAFSYPQAP